MNVPVDREIFYKAYGIGDEDAYEKFVDKVKQEFKTVLHPSITIRSLTPLPRRIDTGGNVHVAWRGEVTGWTKKAEVGGEFVWLIRACKFRGRVWSGVENFSDEQLAILARNEMRLGNLAKAGRYLRAIDRLE